MSEHTPTPWLVDIRTGCLAIYPASENHNCLDGFSQRGILFQGGFGERAPESIYQSVTPLQKANATFIVEACNAHDTLVEVLKDAAISVMHQTTGGPDGVCLRTCRACRVDAALKLAGGA